MYYIKFILIFTIISSFALEEGTNETEEFRKYYGLNLNKGCGNYVIVFKCMSTCRSMSYKIYRLDFQCKCSCHEMKTSTILPYFKWRTNGTRKPRPKTFSPRQYDIVGSLSPSPVEETTTMSTVDMCAGRFPDLNGTLGNGTLGNETDIGNSTDIGVGVNEAATVAGADAAGEGGAAATETDKPADDPNKEEE